jgi:hypothetical protein
VKYGISANYRTLSNPWSEKMSQPKRLIVAYDDGSTKETDFTNLDGQLVLRLAQMGLCPPLEHVGASKYHLLVLWQDGWREVFALDANSAELLRYFVIERIEDRGRLSLDVGGEYPELFIIERTPKGVVEALIIGEDGVRSYGLVSLVARRSSSSTTRPSIHTHMSRARVPTR